MDEKDGTCVGRYMCGREGVIGRSQCGCGGGLKTDCCEARNVM